MRVFDCICQWRFIIGKQHVYGPIYALDLPGHFTGPSGCHTQGRMMTRQQFEDEYADCAFHSSARPEDVQLRQKEPA